jgi:iron complex transport system ATP-binding protein
VNAAAEPALAVEADHLTVRFGNRTALHDVDFRVAAGEFVALAGPNGSGKTTLIRVLLGFLAPDEGSTSILGTPVDDLSIRERARRVAWVPQEESVRDDVPIFEYVLYGRYSHLEPLEGESDEDRALAMRILAEVGLADRAQDGILSISGGERQRATLARALAQDSPILLLDEPTSHLDIGHQLDLLDRVRRLSHERKVTVIAALHDLNLAARFADRIFVLSRGRAYVDGPPGEVLSEDLLARVWGVVADLRRDVRTGMPYLVPHRVLGGSPSVPAPRGGGPVHVVGGGGSAAPLLRVLTDRGFRLTAGALHLLDSDSEAATALGVPAAIEVPFAPLGEEVRAQNRVLLAAARAIVVAPFVVGPSNLANLEDVRPFVGSTPTFLVARPDRVAWDFTGGTAAQIVADLERSGARPVSDIDALVNALESALRPDPSGSPGSAGAGPGQGSDLKPRRSGALELREEPGQLRLRDDDRARHADP